jgi:Na+-translocating ferredoxin:NAD+ oxidoreductase RnfC subunit
MAQIATVATLALAGASAYGQVQQQRQRKAEIRVQQEAAQQQQLAQQQVMATQTAAQQRARQEVMARTIAATRARMAAGGVSPDEGSASALTAGMVADAAQDQAESSDLLRQRLAAGRPSLLSSNGDFQGFVRATQSFGAIARNLLD